MNILYMTMSYDYNRSGLYQNLVKALIKRKHNITIVRCDSECDETFFCKIEDHLDILTVKTMDPFSRNIIKKELIRYSWPLISKMQ